MSAQAKLVRYLQRGLQAVWTAVAKRDQLTGFQRLHISCFVLAWTTLIGGIEVNAQQYAPRAQPVYSSNYAPGVSSGTYAALVPSQAQLPDRQIQGLFAAAENHVSGSWMKLEYFHARIGHNGGALGASVRDINGNIIDLDETFDLPIFDPVNVPPLPMSIPATGASTEDLNWDNLGGIKGSFGIPLDSKSSIEAVFWGLEEQTQTIRAPQIPPASLVSLHGVPPVQAIVIPYTIDGQAGMLNDPTNTLAFNVSPLIVYDAGFFSEYTVNVWTAEVNHVYDLRVPFDGWSMQSIIGYRHEEFSEHLVFGGSFDNRSGYATDGIINTGQFATPQTNQIDSKVHNFRNALQFGFRSEVKQFGFTVGIEPKVAFGLGLIRARVKTSNAREPGNLSAILNDPNLIIDDPESTDDFDRELDFAPSAELNLYAKYDVSDWLRLKFGYNITWLGRVGAADASIRYNSISAADPTLTPDTLDFGVNPKTKNRYITGFTVGGEIIFP